MDKVKRIRSVGRPKGTDSKKVKIIQVACEMFGITGYDGTSIRNIANNAKVDPSTVIHFFGNKEGLFKAVLSEIYPVLQPLNDALDSNPNGYEIVRLYLQVWENDESGHVIRALIRCAIGSEKAIVLVKENLLSDTLFAIETKYGVSGDYIVSQLLGLALTRYITKIPKITELTIDEIAKQVGPVIDHYLLQKDSSVLGANL